MSDGIRIDKWLWAVRLYKTRSIATEECKKGRVMINNFPVKPSREIKAGETIQIKRAPIVRSYQVLAITDKRMAAKLVPDYMIETTPQSELKIIEIQKDMWFSQREKGSGRPTKKERRNLDDFFNT